MTSYDVTLRLWRGDPGGGDLRDYTVACEDGEVVLDAIHRVQATQAGDLADKPLPVMPDELKKYFEEKLHGLRPEDARVAR